MTDEVSIVVCGEGSMFAIGARLAPHLDAGDLILLRGDLGAGKTTLARAIVKSLGSPAAVSSPTFSLIHIYEGGRLPIVHVDAFRLASEADLHKIGLDEYLNARDSVLVVEWPERIERALPEERLEAVIEEFGEDARKISFSARGPRWTLALRSFLEELSEC